MNSYLLRLISKWISVIWVSVIGIFTNNFGEEEKIIIENINQTKNSVAIITELPYETKTIYNSKLPNNITIKIQEGKKGMAYKIDTNVTIIKEPVEETLEVGTGAHGEYIGKMTGYGADCQGCSGILYCKTKKGYYWNIKNKGNTYVDDEYGKVKILAAALSKFPCGTIIKVQTKKLGTFYAIVLDTGSAMKKSWAKGLVHMDLAFTSENNNLIYKSTDSNAKYNVQRWGW